MSVNSQLYELNGGTLTLKDTSSIEGLTQRVDFDAGIIYGTQVVSMGEASGHDVMVGDVFLNQIEKLGNAQKRGGQDSGWASCCFRRRPYWNVSRCPQKLSALRRYCLCGPPFCKGR